jgi:hypothetical protein
MCLSVNNPESDSRESIGEAEFMISELSRLINGEHYLSVMLILILSCILLGRKVTSERVRQSSLWVTVAACALLTAQNILETYAGADPARSSLRMIMSIAGYCLRPAAVLGFLLAVWPAGTRRWYLWIPAGLLIVLTVLGFNFVGDGLRDAFDPKMKR